MIEVEVKLPVDSAERIMADLLKQGFIYKDTICQEDRYYDTAGQMIRGNGQALRLRSVGDGSCDSVGACNSCCITFKGQKLDSVSMTRKELETPVGDMNVMHGILEELGFAVVPPVVRKVRKEFVLGAGAGGAAAGVFEMHGCVDQVDGLGAFLELEIMAEEGERESALAAIEAVLEKLGYSIEDSTTNSYLSMLQGVED